MWSLACVGFVLLASMAQTARAAVGPVWSIQPSPDPAGATSSVLSGCRARRGGPASRSGTSPTAAAAACRWRSGGRERAGRSSGLPPRLLPGRACCSTCRAQRQPHVSRPGHHNRAGAMVPFAERWNGSRWSIQHVPTLPAGRGDVSYSGRRVMRVAKVLHRGRFSGNSAGSSGVALVERWNGVGWSVQRTSRPAGATVSFLTAVSCVSPRSCTAVGFFNTRAGVGVTLGERSNGTRWSIQRTRTPEAAVAAQLVGFRAR